VRSYRRAGERALDRRSFKLEIGIGLDPTVGLNYEEQAQLSREAAQLGYKQIWTPEGTGEDAFQTCSLRWNATREVVDGGVTTGIGVSPVAMRTPMGFAMSAGTLSKMSRGTARTGTCGAPQRLA
jgi:alkanesulfonate monooxygenase SsuD/methylene tetrahydromethanopterin reductase-like flavin-dependent oxidoreductase (luciferase family)